MIEMLTPGTSENMKIQTYSNSPVKCILGRHTIEARHHKVTIIFYTTHEFTLSQQWPKCRLLQPDTHMNNYTAFKKRQRHQSANAREWLSMSPVLKMAVYGVVIRLLCQWFLYCWRALSAPYQSSTFRTDLIDLQNKIENKIKLRTSLTGRQEWWHNSRYR